MDLKPFIDNLEAGMASTVKEADGDYRVDGLLYCGVCKTAKQCRVTILGEERTPMCLCKCGAEQREREKEKEKRIAFEKRVVELRKAGFADGEMQKWTFANDDGESGQVMNVARKYVENFEKMRDDGKGLLLFGDVGSGKTFAAACIANALIDKGYPCMMTNFSRIANTVQGMFDGRQEYYDSFNEFPLLVIDDLSAERKTEYMQEIVFNVIDSRYRAGLPLIITSNLTAEELKNPADVAYRRIFSRVLEMCIPLEVKGADRRRKNLKDSFGMYAQMLGI